MSGWNPIETAPKDGEILDLKTPCGMVIPQEWWVDDEYGWSTIYDGPIAFWRFAKGISQPLPIVPEVGDV